jgi:ELWxxDGT repeat protein
MSLQSSLSTLISSLFHPNQRRRSRQRTATETLECRQLLAADFKLVKDINTVDEVARDITESVMMDGVLYFSGKTTSKGRELWRSDGTDVGTRVVANIAAGSADALPKDFLVIGSTLYFTADDGTRGRELWKTDGTAGGTVIVKDIAAGSADAYPGAFLVMGSTMYFTADDGIHGRELWKTNGTASGTMMVKDIAAGQVPSYPSSLTNANGVLYFSANDGVNGRELWKSNGTSSGTAMVLNLNTTAAGDGIPSNEEIIAVGSTVYFTGNTPLTGTELYKSDGTSSGTKLVRDISLPGAVKSPQSSDPRQFAKVGTQVFFVATTDTEGPYVHYGLWVTNGTESGTVRISVQREYRSLTVVGDGLYYESQGSLFRVRIANGFINELLLRNVVGEVSEFKQVGGITYFGAKEGASNPSLWRTDGTKAGTYRIQSFSAEPGYSGEGPKDLVDWNGTLHFRVYGRQIWKSTGTTSVTTEVVTLAEEGSRILGATSSRLYLSDGGVLYSSNGTAAGTVSVQTVRTLGSAPSNLLSHNDTLFFTADDGKVGTELRTLSNGTIDVFQGPDSSAPAELTVFRDRVYFVATTSTGRKLWKTDGTREGTVIVEPLSFQSSSNPTSLTVVGDSLYFTATSLNKGRELWRVDSRGNAGLVKDLRPGSDSSDPTSLVAVGNQLYFAANNGIHGREMWTSDGTSVGTRMVVDLRPGAESAEPKHLTAVGGRVFFQARNANSGYELFSSTGTAARTILVKDIHPTSSSLPTQLTNVGGTLYFTAIDTTTGRELWKSDGTNAGTVRVSDIALGAASSLPSELTNLNGTLFFQATTVGGDTELWKSNGTAATTVQVRNINPAGSSSPIGLTNVAGYLYFSATNTANGRELWRSDGTSSGTVLLQDFEAGAADSTPAGIVRVQNRLYVSAITKSIGRELYVDDLFDQTAGNDAYVAEYVSSQGGNSVRILKEQAQGAPILLATLPATEPILIQSESGVDSMTLHGTFSHDTFRVAFGSIYAELRLNEALIGVHDFSTHTLAGLSGNDTYQFDESTIFGVSSVSFKISESGIGTDTLDLSKLTSGAKLDLLRTTPQQLSNRINLQLLSADGIENIIGSSFDDVLTGNSLANVIHAGEGNDTIVGGDGNDTIDAGEGDDVVTGGHGSDLLGGGDGNDVFRLSAATTAEADSIVELPNEGVDTISFGGINAPIALGLGLTTPQSAHLNRTVTLNAVDTFENLEGGNGSDVLNGNVLSNELTGGRGNDKMSGGPGDDVYIFSAAPVAESDLVNELAGQGRDTLSFGTLASNVTLNLGITVPQVVHENRTLRLNSSVEFENAAGGTGDDILTGNSRNNVLLGNEGDDQLLGLGGRDILIGGLNFDSLDGGEGEDMLIAGFTDFDKVHEDLNLLIAEWGSSDPIGTRITKLRSGVGPDSIALTAGTSVKDDNGQLDELTGGLGALDWFFRDLTDLITDLNGEVIDEL